MKKLAVGVGAAVVIALVAVSNVQKNQASEAKPMVSEAQTPSATSQVDPQSSPTAEAHSKILTPVGKALEPKTRERLETFSRLTRQALMSDEEKTSYQSMLASQAALQDMQSVLTAGPLPEDEQKDTSSQEAELLGRISGIEITHGQVARVRAVNFIKKSYEANTSNIDYQAYVKSILFAPDLKEQAEMSVKQSMIAAKIDLYTFFSKKIPDLDRYLEESIENSYQRKIFDLLVSKSEKG